MRKNEWTRLEACTGRVFVVSCGTLNMWPGRARVTSDRIIQLHAHTHTPHSTFGTIPSLACFVVGDYAPTRANIL